MSMELGSLYTAEELRQMLGSAGENVAVNRSVVFYLPKNVHLGSNVRIDCFSLLSSGSRGIMIGDYVHIAAYGALFGSGGKIQMESFSGLSSRVTVYTSTDDYVDGFMSNPTVDAEFTKTRTGDVVFKKHALIGCGAVIMPGVTVELGAAVGALSFVNKDVPEFTVVSGVPCRVIKQRNRRLLELEAAFLAKPSRGGHGV
jgi:acetyltransferase-like isoleucine patch superfamily enzyme